MGLAFVGHGHTALTVNRTNFTGTSQTMLARSLNPPARPSVEGVGGRVVSGILLGIFGASALMSGLVGGADPGSSDGPTAIIGGCVLFGLAVLIWLWAWTARAASIKKCDSEMPAWERAMGVWGVINYCARCSVISVPPSPKTYPVDTSVEALTGMRDDFDEFVNHVNQQEEERQRRREQLKGAARRMSGRVRIKAAK